MNFDDFKISNTDLAMTVSIVCEDFLGHKTSVETNASLEELNELLRTLGIGVVGTSVQNRKHIDAASIIGSGKMKEIAEEAKALGAKTLVMDFELSASQMRNIKDATGMTVIDRNTIILEIFAKHAHTKEAKVQIEISRLQYLLPRLSSLWTHFHRQKGGQGVMGGEGEQQIELDRRMIRDRIQFYKKQLEQVVISRQEQKKRRQGKTVVAALVGYTNVGKSSLMNRMCMENVLEENKLFATLDATYRTLNPDTKPPLILIDTVGFISNLPTSLITGFKTTLESAMEADLLLIVSDISDPNNQAHLNVTLETLKELGLDEKEKFFIFNKKDLIQNDLLAKITLKKYPNSFLVSSHDKEDMINLKKTILNYFLNFQPCYDLFVPYEQGDAHSKVMGQTNIIKNVDHDMGIFYRIRIPENIFNTLGLQKYILGPQDPRTQFLD
ncbi:MAG: GTPase HflX [Bacteriovoracaceae bacterium]|nr:GTPase HflX [Bacteriovoracaceae bacterium]